MLKSLWENVQVLNEAEHDKLLHESVMSAINCVRILNERINFEDKDLSQAIKMLDAAKRGLGFVNKLPMGLSKQKHASRVLGNLNKIRSFVNRLVQNVMDTENEEIENFSIDDYFDNDMFADTDDSCMDSDGDDWIDPGPDRDLDRQRAGETLDEPMDDYMNPPSAENEEFSSMSPDTYEPGNDVEFGDSDEIEYDEFGDPEKMGYEFNMKDPSRPGGRLQDPNAFGPGTDNPEISRNYNDEFDGEDMMMQGDRDHEHPADDSFTNALAPEDGGNLPTDYSDYDTENEEQGKLTKRKCESFLDFLSKTIV